jgi:ADP-ribosylglycohydrolase
MGTRDKLYGSYIGAAIGDAMGGPVECNHARRIQRLVGEIDDLLPYQEPYTLMEPHPGYALRRDAGAVTDDTFIRGDLTRFYLETDPPRTPEQLTEWLLDNAHFDQWWDPAIEALRTVDNGEMDAKEVGYEHPQGGGSGWWAPVGILHAGDPDAAAKECRRLSQIWKAPVEQDLTAAIQAGVAEGLKADATYESIIDVMVDTSRSLPRKLIRRGIEIGEGADDFDTLIDEVYDTVLMPEFNSDKPEPPKEVTADVPASHQPVEETDEKYASVYLHEQIPIAVAAFVFSEGDPENAIPNTVMLGRDCDTTATTVGSWVGALHGKSNLPAKWDDTVCDVNSQEIDIRGLARDLVTQATASSD